MTSPAPRRGRSRKAVGLVVPYLVTVFVLVTLNFILPRAMPGNPVEAQLSVGSPTFVYDEQARAELNAYYGLDRPLVEQYGRYLADLARGDLGVSISNHTPVAKLIKAKLPWTLLLAATSVLLATAIGFLAGIHAGWRRQRRSDTSLLTAFVVSQNIPSFILASLALLLFAVQLQWFPLGGERTPFSSYGTLESIADIGRHLVLPALVVASEVAAFQFLLTRSSVVSQLGSDYLVLGRVKGLTERRLKYRHVARNAALPIVGNTAVQLGLSITVMVFVERVFAYPGIGGLLYQSISTRDYPVIQGGFLVVTLLVLSLNFGADLIYRRLDPRTRA